ncbi:MAG TPA: non-canonical purine NTP pyrophosphatase [Thermoanaerobaculia bacterium]|nr:non-canonical purine NTP pyrophosphatase [Thermoanaerobaculia bacterium]
MAEATPWAARLPAFVLVTGNDDKRREAERILGRPVEAVSVELPEIQSLDLGAVLREKAEEAWRRVGRPLVVEETGLELSGLNGFPGPLVKWMLEAIGPAGVARVAIASGDARGRACCAMIYRDERGAVLGEGADRGRLVVPPRGDRGFGWDPVFEPEESAHTYGELPIEVKDARGHRGRAWRDLAARLASER